MYPLVGILLPISEQSSLPIWTEQNSKTRKFHVKLIDSSKTNEKKMKQKILTRIKI